MEFKREDDGDVISCARGIIGLSVSICEFGETGACRAAEGRGTGERSCEKIFVIEEARPEAAGGMGYGREKFKGGTERDGLLALEFAKMSIKLFL